MLTTMPKVGDVVIANKTGGKRYTDVTVGEEYEVFSMNDGNAIFLDDMRDECYIDYDRFECFALKSEVYAEESVGYIVFCGSEPITSEKLIALGLTKELTVLANDEGMDVIKGLWNTSLQQRKRTEIQAKIDALQAELNAL